MSALHTEANLETEIVRELGTRGWIEGKPEGYDRKLALYREDVIEWLETAQPEAYEKVRRANNGDTEQLILERLATTMSSEGALNVLRRGFKRTPVSFDMCAFKPSSAMNPQAIERNQKVRCRVVRQVKYSTENENCIDLVFFINGIPVATLELKTEMTQSVEMAINQYKFDRLPQDPKTNKPEPLLMPKRGALVHFAVSDEEVWMTTDLAGLKTVFLPFNLGYNGGAGNPPNPGKAKTAYLWEQVLERDAWLEIVDRFIHTEKSEREVDGKKVRAERTIFPRYHQWNAVKELVANAATNGAGHKYLIQHSAGSGKSNTIMWLAHRLSTLHNASDAKIFDGIIVVTDRNVLDKQLQENIFQFDHKLGVVERITGEGGSKSEQLQKALEERKPIVIVTIQTFPALMDRIEKSEAFRDRNYAIIADEAHSSQSGKTSGKVKDVLGIAEDEPEEDTIEDEMLREAARRSGSKNISYFAFTATPKSKTMQLFGIKDDDGYHPFHLYTMQQAIDEGFILDVLQNYTPYNFAYRLATTDPKFNDVQVPKSETAKIIARFAKLHPSNILQRVETIVEHFRTVVQQRLKGKAKAMLVTDSRKAAVKYKLAMDKYIAEHKYEGLRTIVAFSGEIEDHKEWPGQKFTEGNLNKFSSSEIPEKFASDEYQVLIVAEKFQTGFDQPLLCAMYVDKKLADINAVQTLCRLNRTYERGGTKKTAQDIFILDFVNDPEDILKAFKKYYRDATMPEGTDPDTIHDLRAKLDGAGFYDDSDVEAYVNAYFEAKNTPRDERKQTTLKAALDPVVDRWQKQLADAKSRKDDEEEQRIVLFRHDLGQFNKAFAFLSQIYNYGDSDLEKRALFYAGLIRLLHNERDDVPIDISGVKLAYVSNKPRDTRALSLRDGEQISLMPGSFVGTAATHEKVFGPLAEIIELLNSLHAPDASNIDKVKFATTLDEELLANDTLKEQAVHNNEEQFEEASDFKGVFDETMIAAKDHIAADNERQNAALGQILDSLFDDKDRLAQFRTMMAKRIHKTFNDQADGQTTPEQVRANPLLAHGRLPL